MKSMLGRSYLRQSGRGEARRKAASPRLTPGAEPFEERTLLTAVIALIDTGIDTANATTNPYIDYTYGYDALAKQTVAQYGTSVVQDVVTHGRYVAEFMVQGINQTRGVPGAGRADVKIMPIRAVNASGAVNISAMIRGIYWAADHGADVINLSFRFTGGEPQLTDSTDPHYGAYLSDAIKYAEGLGAVVVTASGNNNRQNVDLPANVSYPTYADDAAYAHASPVTNLLVAAGVDGSGTLTTLSNWGPIHVDFGAPANSAGETSYSAGFTSGVAGAIADLLPATHTPQDVINVIKQTVTPMTQPVGANWSSTNGNINPAGAATKVLGLKTIDDDSAGTGSNGYTKTGTWDYFSGLSLSVGYGGDASSASTVGTTGTPTATATWTFNSLTPGRYRVWASWYRDGARATDSPFTIKDGSTVLQTVRIDQSWGTGAPAPTQYDANGLPWWALGGSSATYNITGSQLVVQLANNAGPAGRVVQADAITIEYVGPLDAGQTIIDNTDSGTTGNGYTKTGTWDYFSGLQPNIGYGGDASSAWTVGTTGTPTATATWTFNVTPGRYVVWASWYRDSVRANNSPFTIKDGSTALQTVRIDQSNGSGAPAPDLYDQNGLPWWVLGNATYNITGNQLVVQLANNAASGVVQADAIRIERIDSSAILDDDSAGTGSNGYTKTGTWDYFSGLQPNVGYGGDASSAGTVGTTGTPTATATWTFNGLTPGRYIVWASWYRDGARATDSPFTIKNGTTTLQTVRIDQSWGTGAPAPDLVDQNGLPWWVLGGTYNITGNQLVVQLANNASPTGKVVQADAIRIARIVDPPSSLMSIGGGSSLAATIPAAEPEAAADPGSAPAAADIGSLQLPPPAPVSAPASAPIAQGGPRWSPARGAVAFRRAAIASLQGDESRPVRLPRAFQALAAGDKRRRVGIGS